MSILSTIYPSVVRKSPYELAIAQNKVSIYIKMSMNTAHFHTNYFPSTYNILLENLPAVLKTKCFNKHHYTFDKEVLNTEMGHLFEHILLQYLCELKLQKGHRSAVFRGLTEWDWDRDTRGTFHITVSTETSDWEIFPEALRKSEELLRKIIDSPIKVSEVN